MLMYFDPLATFSGSLVGFVLGLIGGGGSVLAVPLLIYVVGVKSPHVAIGTSAIAVALSALAGLIGHARQKKVKWPCALVFASSGIVGAAVGSTLGKAFNGQYLLLFFGILMVVIAGFMLLKKPDNGNPEICLNKNTAPRLLPFLLLYGVGVGLLSGFFGIGGGFLVVPGLMAATDMPLIFAIGSSLVSVVAFGCTTAFNYAISGLVDWPLAACFIGGGIIGGVFGRRLATTLATHKSHLTHVFAFIIAIVGSYIIVRGLEV